MPALQCDLSLNNAPTLLSTVTRTYNKAPAEWTCPRSFVKQLYNITNQINRMTYRFHFSVRNSIKHITVLYEGVMMENLSLSVQSCDSTPKYPSSLLSSCQYFYVIIGTNSYGLQKWMPTCNIMHSLVKVYQNNGRHLMAVTYCAWNV